MKTELPILFKGEMVRQIMAGAKTQTRRVLKPQPIFEGVETFGDSWKWRNGKDWFSGVTTQQLVGKTGLLHDARCPYKVVTRLWVRETWRDLGDPYQIGFDDDERIEYRATPIDYAAQNAMFDEATKGTPNEGKIRPYDGVDKIPWRPSIFMPRWASRLTLEIVEVRVERLQDISEEDAKAEGVEFIRDIPDADETLTNRQLFDILWDSINGKTYPWASNPWVWVLRFKRLPQQSTAQGSPVPPQSTSGNDKEN